MYRKNAWKALQEGEMAKLEAFAEKYKLSALSSTKPTSQDCLV